MLKRLERAVLDAEGAIQAEYRRNQRSSGQPRVGDRFHPAVLRDWRRCERADLPQRADGEYADLPQAVIAAGFDRDDRKFAALARREGIPVIVAVDRDWLDHHVVPTNNGINARFPCGCDEARRFAA